MSYDPTARCAITGMYAVTLPAIMFLEKREYITSKKAVTYCTMSAMPFKYLNAFLAGCWVLIGFVCVLLLFSAFRKTPQDNKMFVCGNVPTAMDTSLMEGREVFLINCASCHNPVKDATGPALAKIGLVRSPEWLCKFISQPDFIPQDERAKKLRKDYGGSCIKFPELSCKEIEASMRFNGSYNR